MCVSELGQWVCVSLTVSSYVCVCVCVSLTAVAAQNETFRFANYYGDHMVLQRGPQSASVWGFVPNCDPVSVMFNSKSISAKLVPSE